jgi:hypothetical protein
VQCLAFRSVDLIKFSNDLLRLGCRDQLNSIIVTGLDVAEILDTVKNKLDSSGMNEFSAHLQSDSLAS